MNLNLIVIKAESYLRRPPHKRCAGAMCVHAFEILKAYTFFHRAPNWEAKVGSRICLWGAPYLTLAAPSEKLTKTFKGFRAGGCRPPAPPAIPGRLRPPKPPLC